MGGAGIQLPHGDGVTVGVSHYINLLLEDAPTYYWPCQEPAGATVLRNIGSGTGNLIIDSGATGNTSGPITHRCHGPNAIATNTTPNANANTTAYTLEGWMASSGAVSDRAVVANWAGPGTMMYITSTAITIYHNSSFLATGYAIPTDGSWHHYALTWDGATQKFYSDGALHTTRSVSGALGSAVRLGIGDYRGGGANTTNSRLAHCAWYVNSCLAPDRIARRMEVMFRSGVSY